MDTFPYVKEYYVLIINFNYLQIPQTPEEWISIEEGFRAKFPHCIGALDGKHILLECPIGSGSQYYNYKKTFSIVLLALVDSDYNFIFADIGAPGRISDGGVFHNSLLWKKIITDDLNLPADCPLSERRKSVPYVFVGDGAFALSTKVMKPYPGNYDHGTLQRTFNYRLSSARVIVENVFGVLTTVFRVLKKPLELQPEKAKIITMSCILLHNFLRRTETSRNIYTPPGIFDIVVNGEVVQKSSWRNKDQTPCALRPLPNKAVRATFNALEIREEFANYFNDL